MNAHLIDQLIFWIKAMVGGILMWLSSDDMVNQYIFWAITLAFVGAIGLTFSLGHL